MGSEVKGIYFSDAQFPLKVVDLASTLLKIKNALENTQNVVCNFKFLSDF